MFIIGYGADKTIKDRKQHLPDENSANEARIACDGITLCKFFDLAAKRTNEANCTASFMIRLKKRAKSASTACTTLQCKIMDYKCPYAEHAYKAGMVLECNERYVIPILSRDLSQLRWLEKLNGTSSPRGEKDIVILMVSVRWHYQSHYGPKSRERNRPFCYDTNAKILPHIVLQMLRQSFRNITLASS